MAGNSISAKANAARIKAADPDFYRRIGKLGGEQSRGGGFGQGEIGRQLARVAGAKGGKNSRRPCNNCGSSEHYTPGCTA